MLTPPFFAYCSDLFINNAEAQKRAFGRIGEVEMPVLSCGAFLRTARVGPLKSMSLIWLFEKRDGQDVVMRVSEAIIRESFELVNPKLIARMEVDSTLEFVGVARLCMVDWDALCLHD